MNPLCPKLVPLFLVLALSAGAGPGKPDDAYKAFAQKVKLDPAELERCKKISPKLFDLLSSRDNWAKWAKKVHERTGLFKDEAVTVRSCDEITVSS